MSIRDDLTKDGQALSTEPQLTKDQTMTDMTDPIFTELWTVYTMDHDDEIFDADGNPVDDFTLDVWAVGCRVEFVGSPYLARTAVVAADRMTWRTACHIRDLHNESLDVLDHD